METKFASHCSYKIRYHIVMCVKYRKQLLKNRGRITKLAQTIKEIGRAYWFETDEMGTDGDHVHVFIGAAPRYSPSNIMQIIKSISAKEMFKTFPEIRQELWGGEFWSDGGYIGTVGDQSSAEIIRKYIQEQGEREEKASSKQLKLFKI